MEQLKVQKELWESANIKNYTYLVDKICFCGFPGEALVVVRNHTVSDFLDPETRESIMIEREGEEPQPLAEVIPNAYPTINDLFDITEDAIQEQADYLDIEYHESTYHPSQLIIDYWYNTVDDELTIITSKAARN
ncbi:MAG: hypothetical protein FH748_13895 [Balneolaceae bacterium]|nr:hypothetical protein [Balneolaceae bacterium]